MNSDGAKSARGVSPFGLGTLLVCALGAPGACNSTENPREIYASASSARTGGREANGSATVGGTFSRATGGDDPFAKASFSGSGPSAGSTGGGANASPRVEPGPGGSGADHPGSDEENASGGSGGAGSGSSNSDCGSAPIATGPFSREALRGAAADCAMWHHCEFENAASALAARARAHASSPTDRSLLDAQRAFRDAMQSWSKLELFQFGPLSSKSESAGKDVYQGQGLRELIYSWPATARCRVEEQLASRTFLTKGVETALVSARGLFGVEYSLFYSGLDTACTAASAAGKLWPTLSEAEISEAKREYARVVAEDVLIQARELSRAWSAEGGNFRPLFVSASGYPSEQEAMIVLGYALIYVEREVKDWKLGIPAGYTLTHPVSGPETPFAQMGTENIRANLAGFRSLFQGCGPAGEGLGFDDWLNEAGHSSLATDLLAALDRAQAAADAFPPLHEASLAEVEVLYRAIKGLTDLLKTDLFGAGSPLGLKLPAGVEGDTD